MKHMKRDVMMASTNAAAKAVLSYNPENSTEAVS